MTLPTSNPSSLATELVTTHRHDVEDDDIGDHDGADGDDDGADGDDDGADGDDLLIMPMWVASVSMSATKNDQSEEEKICLSVCLSVTKNDQFQTNLSVCHGKLSQLVL